MKFTVNMLLSVAIFYGVAPGSAVIRAVCTAATIGNSYHGYNICPRRRVALGDAVSLLRLRRFTLMSREILMFLILQLSVCFSSSDDRCDRDTRRIVSLFFVNTQTFVS